MVSRSGLPANSAQEGVGFIVSQLLDEQVIDRRERFGTGKQLSQGMRAAEIVRIQPRTRGRRRALFRRSSASPGRCAKAIHRADSASRVPHRESPASPQMIATVVSTG